MNSLSCGCRAPRTSGRIPRPRPVQSAMGLNLRQPWPSSSSEATSARVVGLLGTQAGDPSRRPASMRETAPSCACGNRPCAARWTASRHRPRGGRATASVFSGLNTFTGAAHGLAGCCSTSARVSADADDRCPAWRWRWATVAGDQVGDDHVFHAQAGALHGAGAMRGETAASRRRSVAAAILKHVQLRAPARTA